MPNNFTNSTFETTYFDDFKDSDHYHQILFNSSKALQARELTQSQTILNTEIEKFANNIFKEGSVVEPGGITVNNEYEFAKLNTDLTASGGATPDSDYVGKTATGGTSGIQAQIIEVVAASGSDPATIYFTYEDLNGGTQARFTPGETLTVPGESDLVVQTVNTTNNPAIGAGVRVSIADGVYYVKGHFVSVEQQNVIFSKYTTIVYDYVILKVTEDIVTATDDTGLYDNAGGSPNVTAPGADRYRIRLTLDKLSNVEVTDNHIKIAQINNGTLVNEVTDSPTYNFPQELVARRIHENSGDYIVSPFKLKYEEDSAATTSKLDAVVSPGIAIVQGYRINSRTDNLFNIPRAQDTEEVEGEQIGTPYGNYVKVGGTAFQGIANIDTLERLNLHTDTALGGAKVGFARLRSVSENGLEGYKFHLFDINPNSGINFRDIKSIGDSASSTYFNITQENSKSVLYETNKNNLLFELPYLRPNNFDSISLTFQKHFSGTTDGAGALTITVDDASNETFINTADWVVVRSTGAPDTSFTISAGGAGSTTTSFAGLDNSTAYEVLAYVRKASNVTSRTKTLSTTTLSEIAAQTDSDGNTFYSLGKPDIFKLDSVRTVDIYGADVISRFDLDDGQRDNFYDYGRLVLKNGQTAPASVYAKFQHFTHGASGEFFSSRSYTGQVTYSNVPSFRKNDGSVVNLNDVLDFRSVKSAIGIDGTFVGGTGRVHSLPQPTDTVEADVTYYLPRKDKLIATSDGVLEYITGVSSFDPLLPETPPQAMTLYNITMNPFTLSDSDMNTNRIDHRRYTMKDIGRLDDRLSRLEETVSLTMLETDLANINVLDSTGGVRSKSGFFVDNFADQTFSEINNPTYAASIDPLNKTLRPSFRSDNVRLIYDSDLSTNTIKKGDTVYINHSEVLFEENPYATGTININPFNVIIYEAPITLSPSSDEWHDKEYNDTPKVTDGGVRIVNKKGNLWNDWQWNWGGIKINKSEAEDTLKVGDTSQKKTSENKYKKTVTYLKVVKEETVFEQVGERYIESTYIPFMRSKLVYFQADGLKPNSRLFAYFDDRHVNSWVRQESTFHRYSEGENDYGNKFNKATQYPFGSGPSNLTTDANGKIIGSFFIPSTASFRFKTGTRQFKLLDVAPEAGQEFRPGTDDCLQKATGLFSSVGIMDVYEQDLISYRQLTINKSVTTTNKPQPRTSQKDKDSHFFVTNSGRVVKVPGKFYDDTNRFSSFSDARKVGDLVKTLNDMDPVAQSFYVDEEPGIYVTKIGVRFNTKPAGGDLQIAVKCQIRPLTNGYPDSNFIIQGAEAFLSPSDITTSTDGSTISYFTFDEPVYLEGQKDYCFVLITNTNKYNVFLSKINEFVIGSTSQRVAKQPSLGSLFASQNSKTWSARQTDDLTFEIHRAEFQSSGTAFLRNADVPEKLLSENPFTIINGDSDTSGNQNVSVFFPDHGLTVGDTVTLSGSDSADSDAIAALTIAGITGVTLLGPKTVTKVDGFGYQFEVPKSSTDSDGIGGGLGVTSTRNVQFTQAWPNVAPFLPLSTGSTAEAKFTTSKSLAGTETAMQKDATFSNIFVGETNYFDNPKQIANRASEVASLSGGRSVDLQVSMTSGFSTVSPALDLQRASLSTIHNIIDKQDSAATSGFNVPIIFSPETSAFGGSSISKHITKIVTLAETAVGIKVYIAANRPKESDFQLFYRIAASDQLLDGKDFILATETSSNAPNESEFVFDDYEYLIGGVNGTLLPFTKFQLKIVMRSTNAAKVPVFRDLRVIALSD